MKNKPLQAWAIFLETEKYPEIYSSRSEARRIHKMYKGSNTRIARVEIREVKK